MRPHIHTHTHTHNQYITIHHSFLILIEYCFIYKNKSNLIKSLFQNQPKLIIHLCLQLLLLLLFLPPFFFFLFLSTPAISINSVVNINAAWVELDQFLDSHKLHLDDTIILFSHQYTYLIILHPNK